MSRGFSELAVQGVKGLKPYQPGKPIAELEREYGVRDIVKLASNENPFGPSPVAQQRIVADQRVVFLQRTRLISHLP